MKMLPLLCLLLASSAVAQESRSHRKLQVPERGGSGVADRFLKLREMMQQKRSQQERPGDGGFSENEMSFLQNMAEMFQQSGVMPDPSMVPPELVDRIRKDPRAQQQAKEMLERFAKEGKMPNAQQAQKMLKDFQNSQSGQRQLTLPGGAPTEQQPGPVTKDGQARPNDRDSQANRSNRRLDSPTPSGQDSDTEKSQTPGDFLDQLIEQQRNNGETQPLTPEELADASPGFRPSPDSDTGRGLSQPPAIRPGQNDRKIPNMMDGQQGMDEFLEQLKNMDLPQDGTANKPANRVPSDGALKDSVEEARRRSEQQQREKRDAARKRVREKGLSGTLKDMLKDVKEEAGDLFVQEQRDQQTPSTTKPSESGSGGVSQGMINLLDGMKEEIVDLARDLKDQRRKRPSDRSARQNRAGREPGFRPDASAGGQDSGGFFERITESLTQSSGSTPESSPNDSVVPDQLADFQAPQPLIGNGWIMTGAVLLIVFLSVVLLAGRFSAKPIALAQKIQDALQGRRATEIRSRKDVVSAFHEVALSPDHMVQDWWTHEQASNEIAKDKPLKQQSVQTLASIYEQARYLPDDAEFPEQSLQQARDAVVEVQS